jgi:hypothetical protein
VPQPYYSIRKSAEGNREIPGTLTLARPGRRARRAACLTLLCLATLSATRAAAQGRTASIIGRVVNRQTRAPVEGALVRLTWTGRAATTDSTGGFKLTDLAAGVGLLQARAIGHEVGSWAVTLGEGMVLADTFELDAVAVELSPLEVVARPNEDWRSADAFERRRRKGGGYFVTEQQIQEQRPNTLVEILRTVPGVNTACSFHGCQVRMARSTRQCSPEYVLDGYPASLAVGPDFPIQAIRGIEIYPDEFSTPIEFQRINLRCGVIAIWTKMER